MWVILREPSERRAVWMMRWMAETICSRMDRTGSSMLLIKTSESSRVITSCGELAWRVVSDPSWPVFIAWSMSSVSSPRHSPMMIRSGRMRSALWKSCRMVTAPRPSMLGGRASSGIQWAWSSCSSAASSMVMIRSCGRMEAERIFSRVVLPDPVPPEMMIFLRAFTMVSRKTAMRSSSEPKPKRSCIPYFSRVNFRIDSMAPFRDSGGMMALTREPSGRRASTMGVDSSMRRPRGEMMRSMMASSWSFELNRLSVSRSLPRRST